MRRSATLPAARPSRPAPSRRPRQTRLRPQLPSETPAVVGFRQYARFTSIDPDENRRRFYLLSWQPSLFGGGLLVRSWGRLGSGGQSRATAFADRPSAQTAIERLVRRRIRRRYELSDWT